MRGWLVCEQDASFSNPYSTYKQYVQYFTEQGIELLLFFGNNSQEEFLIQNNFYKQEKISFLLRHNPPNFVIYYTFHKSTKTLQLIWEAGIPLINRPDSDGRVSIKFYPFQILQKMLLPNKTFSLKLRAIKFWMKIWLFDRKKQISELLENCDRSSVLAFPSPGCIDEFNKILMKTNRPDLVMKCKFIPYLVNSQILRIKPQKKENKILIVSNWTGDTGSNKNPHLIPTIFGQFFEKYPEYQLDIIGEGSSSLFGNWSMKYPQIKLFEKIDNSNMGEILNTAQIVFFSSSHEGCPRVINEILVLGGTFVCGPLPGPKGINFGDQFGTLSSNFSSKSLLNALFKEVHKWKCGFRDYNKISNYWKKLIKNNGIFQLVETLVNSKI